MRIPKRINLTVTALVVLVALSSISFAQGQSDKKDKTGTNPINFQDDIRIYNEYSLLNTEGDGDQNLTTLEFRTPFAGGKWAWRTRVRYNSIAADFDDDGEDDVNSAGLGDTDFRILTVPYLKGKNAFAWALEGFLNTADEPALGSGTTSIGPQAFYVRFFKGGFGPYQGGLFAPGLQYKRSVHEDVGRSKTDQILVDLNLLLMAKNKTFWFFTDPQIVRDLENNKEFAFVDVEFGWMMAKWFKNLGTQSFYIRPSVAIGGDRPTDGSLELGYKWIGFGN